MCLSISVLSFMKQNFSSMQIKHIDVSFNRAGELTSRGYVEVSSRQHARLVSSTKKKNGFRVPGFDEVNIKPENIDIHKNKNLALNKAKEILKKDDRCFGKHIEKKQDKDRGIEVDGITVFAQRERYTKDCEFVTKLIDFRLP